MADRNKKSLEQMVIERNPQARLTYQIAQQLQSYLPINSLETLEAGLKEIEIDKHRLPISVFAKHLHGGLFPIQNLEELVQKLADGVRSALGVGFSRAAQIKNPAVADIFAAAIHGDPEISPGIPVGYISGTARVAGRSCSEKGGE